MEFAIGWETGGPDATKHSCLCLTLVHIGSGKKIVIPILEDPMVVDGAVIRVSKVNLNAVVEHGVSPKVAVATLERFLSACHLEGGGASGEVMHPRQAIFSQYNIRFLKRLYVLAGQESLFQDLWLKPELAKEPIRTEPDGSMASAPGPGAQSYQVGYQVGRDAPDDA